MKKAEMQWHWERYSVLVEKARKAERQKSYARVVGIARSSWGHIDGMLRHRKKAGNPADSSIEGVTLALRFAPVLFDFETLDLLEQLLKSKRRILKESPSDLLDDLSNARSLMWRAHALWDYLESHGKCDTKTLIQHFREALDDWKFVVSTWESLKIVRCYVSKDVGLVEFRSWARNKIRAKCPNCGAIGHHDRMAVLEHTLCHACRRGGVFVQVPEVHSIRT